MPGSIEVVVNGRTVTVPASVTVWAAVTRAGLDHARRSVTGEARGALCGMGICFECRVTVDGVRHERSCRLTCTPGMRITVDE